MALTFQDWCQYRSPWNGLTLASPTQSPHVPLFPVPKTLVSWFAELMLSTRWASAVATNDMLHLPRTFCECFWRNNLKIFTVHAIFSAPWYFELTMLDNYNLILVLFTFIWPGIYEMEFFYKLLTKVYRVAQRVCIGIIILMFFLAVGLYIWYNQVSLQIIN